MERKIKKNVIGMWDGLKGALVLIVVLGHTFLAAASLCGVSEWPLLLRMIVKSSGVVVFTFFMISGYLFKPKKNGIRKQFQSYLKIYLWAGAAILAAQMIQNRISGADWNYQLGRLAGGLLYGATNETVLFGVHLISPAAMWFFAVIMNGTLLLQLIMRMKEPRLRGALIFGSVCGLFLWYGLTGQNEKHPFMNAPFFLMQTWVAVSLLYTGYLLKKHNLLFQTFPWYFWLGLAAVSGLTYYFGSINMVNNEYRLGMLDWAGGACGALLLMAAYIQLADPEWKIVEWLMWIGRRSIWIIPIHSVETLLIRWDQIKVFADTGVWGASLLIFALRWAVIWIACRMLEIIQQKRERRNRRINENGQKTDFGRNHKNSGNL